MKNALIGIAIISLVASILVIPGVASAGVVSKERRATPLNRTPTNLKQRRYIVPSDPGEKTLRESQPPETTIISPQPAQVVQPPMCDELPTQFTPPFGFNYRSNMSIVRLSATAIAVSGRFRVPYGDGIPDGHAVTLRVKIPGVYTTDFCMMGSHSMGDELNTYTFVIPLLYVPVPTKPETNILGKSLIFEIDPDDMMPETDESDNVVHCTSLELGPEDPTRANYNYHTGYVGPCYIPGIVYDYGPVPN